MEFSELKGKVLAQIKGAEVGSEDIYFHTNDHRNFHMYHSQDCCELVQVNEIVGDIADLLNTPILEAYEETSDASDVSSEGSGLWTFYRLVTIKGAVVLRWLGTSNGYYSERVSFTEVK